MRGTVLCGVCGHSLWGGVKETWKSRLPSPGNPRCHGTSQSGWAVGEGVPEEDAMGEGVPEEDAGVVAFGGASCVVHLWVVGSWGPVGPVVRVVGGPVKEQNCLGLVVYLLFVWFLGVCGVRLLLLVGGFQWGGPLAPSAES